MQEVIVDRPGEEPMRFHGVCVKSGEMAQVFVAIHEEIERQDRKWGSPRDNADEVWLTVLAEEVGEVARAILELRAATNIAMQEARAARLHEELVQVAAVAAAWLEAMERRG